MEESLQKHLGDITVDILVNKAGIERILTLEKSTVGSSIFHRLLHVSHRQVFLLTVYLRGQLIHSLIL